MRGEKCGETPFICLEERSGGPLRERHRTCRHMVFMAHHANPRGYQENIKKKKKGKDF